MATMMDCSNTVSITRSLSPLTVYCVGNPPHPSSPSQHPTGWFTAHFLWPGLYTVSCLMGTCCRFWQGECTEIHRLCVWWVTSTFLHLIGLYPQRVSVHFFNNMLRISWSVSPRLQPYGQHEETADCRKQHPLQWDCFRKQHIFISYRFIHVYIILIHLENT